MLLRTRLLLLSAIQLLLLLLTSTSFALPPYINSCTANFAGGARLPYPMCDVALPLDQRLADLISRMTYAEKCAALDTHNPSVPRLGIPSLPVGEGLHGVNCGCGQAASANSTGCATSFPAPIGLGASFDIELWHEIGAVIGTEARALNNQNQTGAGIYLFTPNINMVRDPRWGRAQEVPGEDPTVTSAYARQYIGGLQQGADPRYLQAAATAKHLSVYDLEGYIPRTDPQPQPVSATCDTPGGCERWNFDASPPLRDFADYFMRPFEAAVKDADVSSIMCSYNAVYGKPSCGSEEIQQGLVRDEWEWSGMIVSDYTAVELMQDEIWGQCQPPYPPVGHCTPAPFGGGHNYTHTEAETAHAAFVAGTDYNLGDFYRVQLWAAFLNGTVSKQEIDLAIARVYTLHFRLGLLDPLDEQFYVTLGPQDVDNQAHRDVALRAAEESIVLLQNNRQLLPIAPSGKKIAFIGPHANATIDMLSNYHGDNVLVYSHSPLEVAHARQWNVVYERGCNICDIVPPGYPNMPCPPGNATDVSGIPAAVAAAKSADVAIVFLGSDQTTEAENFDRDNTSFAGVQEQLLREVVAAQPNTIVVLINGGTISSVWMKQNVDAIVEAWYPGELGGDAILNVLTGAYNPAGKLATTVYQPSIVHRDIRDVDLSNAGGVTYLWIRDEVLWPFGWGLSYTTFSFKWDDGKLLADEGDSMEVQEVAQRQVVANYSVVVTNTGTCAGDVVVTSFLSSGVAEAPLKQLVAFTRLHNMMPGESRLWIFGLETRYLTLVNEHGERMLHAGLYKLSVGDVVAPAEREFALKGEDVELWASPMLKRLAAERGW